MKQHNPESWFSLSLGDANMADEEEREVCERFEAAWRAASKPTDVAMFRRLETAAGLHCHVVLYFTPGGGFFATQVNACRCRQSGGGGLKLLIGDAEFWGDLDG